ncbi:MAG: hypothetical protein H8E56_05065 [Candidatus Marinimicrobia bacterium]|nr:hypothetical protein [Candidatus Neomarinimicrobiota bacterium]
MRKEKRVKNWLIPARHLLFISIVAGGKAGNAVNTGIMDNVSPVPYLRSGNEKLECNGNPVSIAGQANFKLFNLPAL